MVTNSAVITSVVRSHRAPPNNALFTNLITMFLRNYAPNGDGKEERCDQEHYALVADVAILEALNKITEAKPFLLLISEPTLMGLCISPTL